MQQPRTSSAPFHLVVRFIAWSMVLSVPWLTRAADAAPPTLPAPSIARIWDEETLSAIRIDLPHPPVHARNLFHVSVAMYDAWAAYDPIAVGYLYRDKHTATDLAAARREAISFAAYRILAERYALSRNAKTTLSALAARMSALGYNKDDLSLDGTTAASIGNRVAAAVSSFFLNDGALQARAYLDLPPDQGGYRSVNQPLDVGGTVNTVADVNHWQPLLVTNAVAQNGVLIPSLQKFLGAQWLGVRPFALARADSSLPWMDPGPPPHLAGTGDLEFRSNVVAVIQHSSELTPDDGVLIDISPGAFGNNHLGANDGTGHPVNPATGLTYTPNLAKRADFARVLAEYWADGPDSETPPGHWNLLANLAADHPALVKRIGGQGPVVDALEWDVKIYLALNGALHDAACAAWSLKRFHDGWRPITAIRYMGQLGQSSDPKAPSFHPNGLPLVPDLIEIVTPDTSQPAGRHAGLPVGAIVIRTWPGQPADLVNQASGVRWVLAATWMPYQRKTFVTPAFPGYISGHSTFSRAAAEVLAAMTGSPFFPGGMATHSVPADTGLLFEKGPSQAVQLQWATYFDAADQAGLSRIWGGIHPPVDDLTGRRLGAECGRGAWALAQQYYDGSVLRSPIMLQIARADSAGCEIRFNTVRGFFYKLQSASSLEQAFSDDPLGFTQAMDSSVARVDAAPGRRGFFRVIRAEKP